MVASNLDEPYAEAFNRLACRLERALLAVLATACVPDNTADPTLPCLVEMPQIWPFTSLLKSTCPTAVQISPTAKKPAYDPSICSAHPRSV